MTIEIDHNIRLELLEDKYSQAIFDLVNGSRSYLEEWLPWVGNMKSVDFIRNFIQGSVQRNKEGHEFAFVIIKNEKVVGRIGVYKIDSRNKTGEIGYWIGQNEQGQGIVTRSCERLIGFCFNDLDINRLEIRCGTGNIKSQTVPERLNFTKEGIIRQGELIHDKFLDLYLYSLLNEDKH